MGGRRVRACRAKSCSPSWLCRSMVRTAMPLCPYLAAWAPLNHAHAVHAGLQVLEPAAALAGPPHLLRRLPDVCGARGRGGALAGAPRCPAARHSRHSQPACSSNTGASGAAGNHVAGVSFTGWAGLDMCDCGSTSSQGGTCAAENAAARARCGGCSCGSGGAASRRHSSTAWRRRPGGAAACACAAMRCGTPGALRLPAEPRVDVLKKVSWLVG